MRAVKKPATASEIRDFFLYFLEEIVVTEWHGPGKYYSWAPIELYGDECRKSINGRGKTPRASLTAAFNKLVEFLKEHPEAYISVRARSADPIYFTMDTNTYKTHKLTDKKLGMTDDDILGLA